MDLIAVGDVMVDVHVQAPALKRGGDVHGRVRLQPAGTSANAAVWAASDGAEARVHGRVGDDLAGRLLRDALAERGVDPALTVDAGAPSGTMLVVVEAGERSMVADRGANARLTPDDLPASLDAGAVLVSGYLFLQEPTTPAGIAAIERATARFVGVEASSWPLVEASGTMLVVVEAGERSMVADRGANARLTPEDLPASLDAGAVLVSGYLFLQGPTTPAGIAAIERATARFVGVEASSWPLVEAFGAGRFLSDSTAAGANVLLANEREAEVLVGLSGTAAARALGERYRVACVKLGEKGAAMSFDGSLVEAAAEPVIEVDATGAGDAFDGVLLAALARGDEPEAALRRACHAGALVAASADTWPEVHA